MRKYLTFLTSTLVVLFFGSACSSSKTTSSEPSVNWLTFSQVQDSLRHHPKKVLVDVYATWCSPCKKMDKVTYNDPEVVKYLNKHFYAVKFNAESMDTVYFKSKAFTNSWNKNHTHNLTYELAAINNRIAFPTTVILDQQLNKIETIAALLYPLQMLELLKSVATKSK
ncbi:MAG: thioredoxin-related protein [Saprospiraceae bacterium]|jgi:thioredoxin-related protein